MLSFRCRHRPEATSTQPQASTTSSVWEAVNRNEHRFSCRVFGFDQVNQVTTKVKSEPTLIKERRACTRSVGMAFAESRSLTGPSDDFTNIFLHPFRPTPKPYSLASVATTDEHQPRVQQLTIAGNWPTKACTSALALGYSLAESL